MSIKQSNPVLYFLLGGVHVMEEHAGHAVVTVPEVPDEDWFRRSAGDVRMKFYSRKFVCPGVIRVNFILNADDRGLLLPGLLNFSKEYIAPFYPSGMFTDIYCVLDDVNFKYGDPARARVSAMLQDVSCGADTLVYLFSNVGSDGSLVTAQNISKTISLLSLFKDAEPPVISDQPDAFRYTEFNFTDSCFARSASGCRFLTAGCASLSFPRDAVRDLLAAYFLKPDAHGSDTRVAGSGLNVYEALRDDITFMKSGLDYTLGLAVPPVPNKELANMTNGEIISRMFGNRLEKITDEEESGIEPAPVLHAEGSVYALLRLCGKGGARQSETGAAIEANEREIAETEAALKTWLGRRPSVKERVSRRLSLFAKQNWLPYRVAGGYMLWLYALKRLRKRDELLRETLRRTEEFNNDLLSRLPVVDEHIARLLKSETEINAEFETFTADAAGYFVKKFAEFALREKDAIGRLTREMTEALLNNEFPAFVIALAEYIERDVLSAEEFNMPIVAVLEEMSAGTDRDCMTDRIAGSKRFNIRLKTGFAGLHSEVNIFMRPDRAAQVKQNYERGRERANLFTDEAAGSVEVLYHAGAFGIGDLLHE